MTAERQIPGVWSRLTGGQTAAGTVDPAAAADVAQFAELTSPALAATLSSGIGVGTEEAHRSRLLNRLRRVTGLRWARCAAEAGIDVVCIKGLATAHCLYTDPDLRAMTDSDLVVRACDYRRLVALFEAHGLEQGKVRARSPWGFVSDASVQPMGQVDGASTIDIHIHPDAWPLHRALTTDDLFARAVRQDTDGGMIRVPCPTDMLVLAASHAARDLFGPGTAKTMVDAMLLLRHQSAAIDWPWFERTARRGLILRPARAFLACAVALGGLEEAVPAALARPPGGREFTRMLDDYVRLFPRRAGTWQRLRRELLLAAEPQVALHRNIRRLTGLVRPRRRLPLPATA